jgi:hypothetical protein
MGGENCKRVWLRCISIQSGLHFKLQGSGVGSDQAKNFLRNPSAHHHQGQKLDILKLDCEGCKWGVLKQLACYYGQRQLKQQVR